MFRLHLRGLPAPRLGNQVEVVSALGGRNVRYFYAFVDEQLLAEQASGTEAGLEEAQRIGREQGVEVRTG